MYTHTGQQADVVGTQRYVHAYMHVYMHMYTCAYIHTCICTYMCRKEYVHTRIHLYTFVYTYLAFSLSLSRHVFAEMGNKSYLQVIFMFTSAPQAQPVSPQVAVACATPACCQADVYVREHQARGSLPNLLSNSGDDRYDLIFS